jgi:hypothetical protein
MLPPPKPEPPPKKRGGWKKPKNARGGKLTAEAFEVYYAMGEQGRDGTGRSLPKCRQVLVDRYEHDSDMTVPTLATFHNWSSHLNWAQKIIERDLEAQRIEATRAIEAKAEELAAIRDAHMQNAALLMVVCRDVLTKAPPLLDAEGKPVLDALGAVMPDDSLRRPRREGEITPRMIEVAASALDRAHSWRRIETDQATNKTDVTSDGKEIQQGVGAVLVMLPEKLAQLDPEYRGDPPRQLTDSMDAEYTVTPSEDEPAAE